MPPPFIPVADLSQIAPGHAIAVTAGDREIALFNVDGTIYALDNICPHQGGPLAEGYIEGDRVTCPWHAWCFRIRDGRMTMGDFAAVDVFDVQIDGSTIAVSPVPRAE